MRFYCSYLWGRSSSLSIYFAQALTRDRVSAHPEFFVVGYLNAEFALNLLRAVPMVELGRGEPERQNPQDYHLLMMDMANGDDAFHC